MRLSEFLILKRRQNHLRQQDLARQLGIGSSYLSAVESGRRLPKSTTFWNKLSEVLRLDDDDRQMLHQILQQSKSTLRIPPDTNPQVREVLFDLVEFGNQLTPDQLAIIRIATRPKPASAAESEVAQASLNAAH